MEKSHSMVSKQTLYLSVLIVFIAGFISGVAFTVFKTNRSTAGSTATVSQQGEQSQQESQAILNLEAEVTANPQNFQAWTQLGNLYFDTNQYQKAISAYTKSLELHSGSANLWTDLGVMYRRAGQPEKALESFDKALSIDPNHQPSRFNKGIVLFYDLGKSEEAIKAWESLLAQNPDYRTGNNALLRDFVEQVKKETSGPDKN